MPCIKTGFHAYLEPHGAWLYGDAFELYGVVYFRICEVSHNGPIRDVKHFTISNYANWFDENQTSQAQNSTMICDPFSVTDHGYEGVSIDA